MRPREAFERRRPAAASGAGAARAGREEAGTRRPRTRAWGAAAGTLARFAGTYEERRDIRRIGAASLDLCNVAAGRTDAYFERGLKPWDHAAGGLIAAEAGARVTGIGGGTASAELLVAAAPELARALEERLERPRA
ncbi:inositol monophosphatase family protein [Clavibacter michiganensis]|uniref:inositol monophosphatase family protein n=1 Tax=Clavibacter michiganensis TaxID=28447 RepID=UPI00374D33DB